MPASALQAVEREARSLVSEKQEATSRVTEQSGVIDVFVHVVTEGNAVEQGNVPDQQIKAQVKVLNEAFEPLGLEFRLAGVQRVNRPEWRNLEGSSPQEVEMKTSLREGKEDDLNLFLTKAKDSILGWATFPWDVTRAPELDGVVIDSNTLPGGSGAPFNEGDTLVHEVGHWMGLAHTFQAPSDAVHDTPHHQVNHGSPPPGTDTDPRPGVDPLNNYMNYTDDALLNHFTKGQIERMRTMLAAYRDISRPVILPRPSEPLAFGVTVGAGGRPDLLALFQDESQISSAAVAAESTLIVRYDPDLAALGLSERDIENTLIQVRIDGQEMSPIPVNWTTDGGRKRPELAQLYVPYSATGEVELSFETHTTDGRKITDGGGASGKTADRYVLDIQPYLATTIHFAEDGRELADSKLIAGGSLKLSFDADRLNAFAEAVGPDRSIEAFVAFDDGPPQSATVAFVADGEPRFAMPSFGIPEDAREARIWFRATTSEGVAWDSDFGRNYTFEVSPAH